MRRFIVPLLLLATFPSAAAAQVAPGEKDKPTLNRALDAAAKDDVVASPLLSGVEITEKELLKAFEKHGIARVESVGQKLDPNRHQAMLEVVQEGAEPGQIVAELQTGYVLKDRLLRPAMVTVAKEA